MLEADGFDRPARPRRLPLAHLRPGQPDRHAGARPDGAGRRSRRRTLALARGPGQDATDQILAQAQRDPQREAARSSPGRPTSWPRATSATARSRTIRAVPRQPRGAPARPGRPPERDPGEAARGRGRRRPGAARPAGRADQARLGQLHLAGERADRVAVRQPQPRRLDRVPPGHRHRGAERHADPRLRGRHGRARRSPSRPPAATATSPASSTAAASPPATPTRRGSSLSVGQHVSQGQVIGISDCTGPLLRPARALRGARERHAGRDPARLPVGTAWLARSAPGSLSGLAARAPYRPAHPADVRDLLRLRVPRLRRADRPAAAGDRPAARLGVRDRLQRARRRPRRRAARLHRPELQQGVGRPARQHLLRQRARVARAGCSGGARAC